jgi:hypothetical protein
VPNVDDRPDAQELIARRYQDPSVLRFVSTLSPEQAVGMYGEMLELIETRHLQPPAPQALVQRGIENVIDALQNEAFLRAIPLQVMPQQYQAFEQSLSMQLQRMPIRSSEEAVAVMQMVMQAAQQQLGLPPAVVGVEFLYGAVESLDRFSTFVLPEAARATSQQLGQTGSSSATQSASISGVTMIDPSAGVGYMKL